jgi:hypothetical protein
MLMGMNGIAATTGIQNAGSAKDLAMLKKTQDFMKQQSAQLLAALPEPMPAPGPAGVGGTIDIRA